MRGPERLPFCENETGWSVHKTCVEAADRGLLRLPRPRPALGLGQGRPSASDMHARKCPSASGLGPALAEPRVIGRDRSMHACPRPRAGLGLGRRDRPR
eukprot:366037-Chlamydomonas_euryale.AAC.1